MEHSDPLFWFRRILFQSNFLAFRHFGINVTFTFFCCLFLFLFFLADNKILVKKLLTGFWFRFNGLCVCTFNLLSVTGKVFRVRERRAGWGEVGGILERGGRFPPLQQSICFLLPGLPFPCPGLLTWTLNLSPTIADSFHIYLIYPFSFFLSPCFASFEEM